MKFISYKVAYQSISQEIQIIVQSATKIDARNQMNIRFIVHKTVIRTAREIDCV